jgi:hypothetical protein
MSQDYVALQHVRHAPEKGKGRTFAKGSTIPAGTLSEKDVEQLTRIGAIGLPGPQAATKVVVIDRTPWLTADELSAYSLPQLSAYGAARGVTFAGKSKEELLSELSQAAQAGTALAAAHAQAQAEGRG